MSVVHVLLCALVFVAVAHAARDFNKLGVIRAALPLWTSQTPELQAGSAQDVKDVTRSLQEDWPPTWFSGNSVLELDLGALPRDAKPWLACLARLRLSYQGGSDGELGVTLKSLVSNGKRYTEKVKCFDGFDFDNNEFKWSSRNKEFTCADLRVPYEVHGPVLREERGERVLPSAFEFKLPNCETRVETFDPPGWAHVVELHRKGSEVTAVLTQNLYQQGAAKSFTVPAKVVSGELLGLKARPAVQPKAPKPKPATGHAVSHIAVLDISKLPASPAWLACFKKLNVDVHVDSKGAVTRAKVSSPVLGRTFARDVKCRNTAGNKKTLATRRLTSTCKGLRVSGPVARVKSVGGSRLEIPVSFRTDKSCDTGVKDWRKNPLVYVLRLERKDGKIFATIKGKLKAVPAKVREGALLSVKK